MASGLKAGRVAAEASWSSIKAYLGKMQDKNVEFSVQKLRSQNGQNNYVRGLNRLQNRGVIKVLRKEYGYGNVPINVYSLGDGIRCMGLAEILDLNYQKAARLG
jgi:hypothetical protein